MKSALISKKASAFYEKEAEERRYLKGYEGYDKRQLRKMTHLEQINGNLYVFDYRNRNVLTNQASVFWVEGGDEAYPSGHQHMPAAGRLRLIMYEKTDKRNFSDSG